jgi:hypothetical protein
MSAPQDQQGKQRKRERLLIAGGLFKRPTSDIREIQDAIKAMPPNVRQRLVEMVDWVEEYTNSKMKE